VRPSTLNHPLPLKQRLIQQVGRSARLRVMNELKRTQGMCVGDLAEKLHMSYMGVKGVCLDLQKRGLLDTWRTPQKIGRPQLYYRLTQRAHDLFPTESNQMTIHLLEAAQKLYGAAAADKLLLVVFQRQAEQYTARLRGGTVAERAKALAHLRDNDGYMSEFEADESGTLRIVEHHSPILDLLRSYPLVAKLETELFQRLLGTSVQREEQVASGQFRATFTITVS
jgi:predicted ArsR family transcriptional regulator